MRRLIVFSVCVTLALVACGSDKKKSAPPASTTSPTSTTATSTASGATTTPSVTAPVVTDVFPTTPLACQAVPVPATPVKSPAPGADVFLSKVDELGDKCVDHVVFSFTSKASGPPGYTITYGSPPFTQDASGAPVTIKGSAFIVVKVQPGYGYDFVANKPTYTGPKSITPPNTNHVTQIVETGDFEGVLTWVIGLTAKRPFTVEATGAPQTQLAVTVS